MRWMWFRILKKIKVCICNTQMVLINDGDLFQGSHFCLLPNVDYHLVDALQSGKRTDVSAPRPQNRQGQDCGRGHG